MGRKFGMSFSWKRASGLSAAKGRLSRRIGIPLTKSGRQRKAGRMLGSFGLFLAFLLGGLARRPHPPSPGRVTYVAPRSFLGCFGKLALAIFLAFVALLGIAVYEQWSH